MSEHGIRAAKWIRRVQPKRASAVAAELRNAITPASLVVGELGEDQSVEDVRASIDMVLAVVHALETAAPERTIWTCWSCGYQTELGACKMCGTSRVEVRVSE